MYFIYLLYSEAFDSFYIGYTADLENRLRQHNAGLTISTKAKRPWKLVYTEAFTEKVEAIKRERFLKNQRNKEFYKKLCSMI